MKKIILAAMMMGIGASASAEWVRVGGNDKVTAYADPATLRQKGNIMKVTSLFDFKAESLLTDGSPYMSVMRETEFNCKDHVQHMVGYSIYSANMGKGKQLEKGSDPQDWKPVTPSGIAHAMWNFACERD